VGIGGVIIEDRDDLGGVFQPITGKGLRPVYSYGNPASKTRPVMFTCPVSAVPAAVWALLELWWHCRLAKTLPLPGGWLDQPVMVRRAFPVFEQEMLGWEQQQQQQGSGAAAVAGAVAAMKAVGGNRRPER
jgi:hypothetical protein